MGRGRSSSSSRGRSSFGGGRGRSSTSRRSVRHGGRTTIIIGGNNHYSNGRTTKAGCIAGGIICLLLGIVVFVAIISGIVDANRYASVKGTCISNEYAGGYYYTTYSYEVDGKSYINRSDVGWELAEDEGKVVTIYYEKDNPNNITEEKPGMGPGVIIAVSCISLIFISFGIALIINGIKMKNVEENAGGLSQEETEMEEQEIPIAPAAPQEPQEVQCSYCGSKYKKSLSSCPRCGAGK